MALWETWVNKTEDLFLYNGYFILCKSYPKGLLLSMLPLVFGHAALASGYAIYAPAFSRFQYAS